MTRRSASALKPPNDLEDVRRKLDQFADEGHTSRSSFLQGAP
ncbi:hypothetical protein [Chondromyces apiculatus]|nr:hypothetical protein [Chondromyces apiculatus]